MVNKKHLDKAFEILSDMLEKGITPKAESFGLAMEVLTSMNQYKEALELFSKMETLGGHPGPKTCGHVAQALVMTGQINAAKNFFEKSVQFLGNSAASFSSVVKDLELPYISYITALIRSGNFSTARKLIEEFVVDTRVYVTPNDINIFMTEFSQMKVREVFT